MKAKIHVIDEGTVYDIPGQLRSIADQIEKKQHGNVREVIVITRAHFAPGKGTATQMIWFGKGTVDAVLTMLERAKQHFIST